MTIRHLEIFIAVADCGKMRLAAEKLFISQPSVSQAIQDIEAEYHVQLFERLNRKIYITPEGERLLQRARYLVEGFHQMEYELKNAGANHVLQIGGSVSVGTFLMGKYIGKLRVEKPEIQTSVVIHNTDLIEDMILKSTLDLAVVEGEIVNRDIIKIPVYHDKLQFVCSKEYPLAKKKKLTVKDLQGVDFIIREEGSSIRKKMDDLFSKYDIQVNYSWNSSNTESIKEAVACNLGVSLLSSMLIEKEVNEGIFTVLPLAEESLNRDICLIYHKDKFISKQMADFIEVCQSYYKN